MIAAGKCSSDRSKQTWKRADPVFMELTNSDKLLVFTQAQSLQFPLPARSPNKLLAVGEPKNMTIVYKS